MSDSVDERIIASEGESDNPRLDRWLERTTTPLDMLALLTIWLTLVPFASIHRSLGRPAWWIIARLAISGVYLVDMAVRTALSRRRIHYVLAHPVGVFSVIFPAIRLIFSLRLLRAMFRKGNLAHFLGVAVLLFANLTIIVYGFEHDSSGANITSLGIAAWWACVTLFTVGYGDYYPVTLGGRMFAVILMALGLVVAAVITAQIASTFMDQAAARRASLAKSGVDPDAPDAADGSPEGSAVARFQASADRIEERLAHMETLLLHRPEAAPDGGTASA